MRILFITSTLKRSGPTNQLYSLSKHLRNYNYEINILTLSNEPNDSRSNDFEKLGLKVDSLGLSRLKGMLKAKKMLENFIKHLGPFNFVHTQGIRADSLLSKISGNFNWALTSHNNPDIDYPMKFGFLKGSLMAWYHKQALKSCPTAISCSNTIKQELELKSIKSLAVQNGVELDEIDEFLPANLDNHEKPIFITVGSLIDRKNMESVILAFNEYSEENKGTLFIIGDGPNRNELNGLANSKTIFTGNIENVPAYLKSADFFISASKAEGLPYTVLEALAADLTLILSDIPSHQEIYKECESNCHIFQNDNQGLGILDILKEIHINKKAVKESRLVAENNFSAKIMAANYHEIYHSLEKK